MLPKLTAFLIIFFLIINLPSYSQDTVSAKYFPLKAGNSWTYRVSTLFETHYIKREMNRDTLINSIRYFYYPWYNLSWLRYDSLNGNLLFYTGTQGCSSYTTDKILDSLASGIGNTVNCQHQATYTRTCINISNQTVFYLQKPIKEFKHDGLYQDYFTYARDFGIIEYCGGEPPPCTYFETLKGCVIDGIVYGDTTLTSIRQVNEAVPNDFALTQNFPNPFNPRTIINYELPKFGKVKLLVFDILGNEVETLVNDNQKAGSYSVEFDGSNFSSGIYFYKLEAEDFIAVNRMVLIK